MNLLFSNACLHLKPSIRAVVLGVPAILAPWSTAQSPQAVKAAQPAEPLITLVHDELPAVDPFEHRPQAEARPGLPENFRQFSAVRVGEPATAERLTLRFSATSKITALKVSRDFAVEGGSTCVEGKVIEKDQTCALFLRFTPQGPGRRLGKLTVELANAPRPLAFGLGGYGYAPALSFIPSTMSTLSPTVKSGAGVLSGAQYLAVDGSDTLYVADTGNNQVEEFDSSGVLNSLGNGFGGPTGIAVDSVGEVYVDSPSLNTMYEIYAYGPYEILSGSSGTGPCENTAPCQLDAHALVTPGAISIDPNDTIFFTNYAQQAGVAMSPQQDPLQRELIFLYDPFPFQASPSAPIVVDSNDNLYTVWSTPGICAIMRQSLYNAENYFAEYPKVAGGRICGYSGDGGLAGNAEIGPTIGQMAFDTAGNLYFTDQVNSRVRRIDYTTGIIQTVIGNGVSGNNGDAGSALAAEIKTPTGVGVDSNGQIYVISSAATTGQVIRKANNVGILYFSTHGVGTTASTQHVTVSNTGNYAMTLTNAVFTGANAADFAIDTTSTSCLLTPGSTLASGQSCKVGIYFKPTGTGNRSAYLTFNNNTVTGQNQIVVSGVGTQVTLSPTSIAFGSEASGTATANTPVVLSNIGTTALTISKVALTGANPSSFTIAGNGCGASLAGGASCTVQVNFKPALTGPLSASLTFSDSDGTATQSVTMTGTGTASAVKKPGIIITHPVKQVSDVR